MTVWVKKNEFPYIVLPQRIKLFIHHTFWRLYASPLLSCHTLTFDSSPRLSMSGNRNTSFVFRSNLFRLPLSFRGNVPVSPNSPKTIKNTLVSVPAPERSWSLSQAYQEILSLSISMYPTCQVAGLDLDDVGCFLHHLLIINHSWQLTHFDPLRSFGAGQPVLIGEQIFLLSIQIPHEDLKVFIGSSVPWGEGKETKKWQILTNTHFLYKLGQFWGQFFNLL